MLRGLSGSVVAGLVVLTAVVIGTEILGGERGFPGPGVSTAVWHVVATVVALFLQRLADHRGRLLSVAGSLGVFVVTGVLLWTQWWN
ncbi:hypothetical protein GCM10007304_30720 [Rhodococcoides trifolii]|uniref:Uncharacterized protein n=1 Tax=Rhodococcoides trifolii TaxID=908250 RepID=A0A917FYW0_9NOCA|nr:hypothetical protein [Rhodococcus trifolii]GGG14589.1 hypothetical protein GCM10007304_30720 [Rhodococcus trifolii]